METKEIKINIPKGYEIDKENSTFECIKFTPKKEISNLTYEKVCNSIFPNGEGCYIDIDGEVINDCIDGCIEEPNNAPNKKQLERLLALNQLMNIAHYYDAHYYDGTKCLRAGYYIYYDTLRDRYSVGDVNNYYLPPAEIKVLFIHAEDAKAVIDNPNFRSILDTLCK